MYSLRHTACRLQEAALRMSYIFHLKVQGRNVKDKDVEDREELKCMSRFIIL